MSDARYKKPPENFLSDFANQENARNLLWKSYVSGRIASAYLFSGPKGVGKFAAALEWIKFIKCPNKSDGAYCNRCNICKTISLWDNPDVYIIFPMPANVWEKDEKTAQNAYEEFRQSPYTRPAISASAEILISMIYDVQKFLSTPATSNSGKFVLVADAHQMNTIAANAFLKTLEEPPPDVHIILITNQEKSILPTIISRTQIVKFNRMNTAEICHHLIKDYGLSSEKAEYLARISEGSMATANSFLTEDFQSIRGDAIDVFKWSIQADLINLWQWANNDAPSDSNYITIFLRIIHSLVRDTAVFLSNGEILNIDVKPIIQSAAQKNMDAESALNLSRQIEQLREDTNRNPQFKLIYGAIVSVLMNGFHLDKKSQ